MRQLFIAVRIASPAVAPIKGSAQEPVAKSKIVSVGVFKNGLALVQTVHSLEGANDKAQAQQA